MGLRVAGAALIAAVVGSTILSTVSSLPPPGRMITLIEYFPVLKASSNRLFAQDVTLDCIEVGSYVPDPFLRPESTTPEDTAYDNALNTLLSAQSELRRQEEISFDSTDHLAAREEDVLRRARLLDEAQVAWRLLNRRANSQNIETAQAALRATEVSRDLARDRVAEDELSVDNAREAVARAEATVVSARQARDEKRRGPAIEGPAYRGTLVRRNAILLLFRENASAETIRDFVARQRLVVHSGLPSIALLIVETTDANEEGTYEGAATRIRAIVDRLEDHEIVKTAVQDALLGEHIVPHPNSPKRRDWFIAGGDALINSGFPKVWNFNQAIAARGAHPEAGVLDIGFLTGLCDLGKHCELDVQLASPCGKSRNKHGTATAGVIGAGFDDGIGVDGAAPHARIFGCAPYPPKQCDETNLTPEEIILLRRSMRFSGFIDALKTLLTRVPADVPNVINASVGYNWHKVVINPAKSQKVQQLVEGQGTIVRDLLRPYSRAILVASAGNDHSQPAVWASAFNWAGLGASTPQNRASQNVIVVQALQTDGQALASSNVGGTISAIGQDVLTIIGENKYGNHQGTSAAAPLVTATIAIMQAINPKIQLSEIKSNLGIGSGKPLNAFEAVRRSSPNADLDLADLVVDGKVDEADFQRFKDDFKAFDGIKTGTFTRDLNGDGTADANDAIFCRIDLDGDDTVTRDDLEVMIRAWTGTPAEAAALRTKLDQ